MAVFLCTTIQAFASVLHAPLVAYKINSLVYFHSQIVMFSSVNIGSVASKVTTAISSFSQAIFSDIVMKVHKPTLVGFCPLPFSLG